MTRFEELQAIINKNKKISNNIITNSEQDDSIEVAGLTDSGKGQPRIEFADDETDMSLIDQLYYRNQKNIPNRGDGAEYWND